MDERTLLGYIDDQLGKIRKAKEEGILSDEYLTGYEFALLDVRIWMGQPEQVIKRAEEARTAALEKFRRAYTGDQKMGLYIRGPFSIISFIRSSTSFV